jgi:hypothetical protein
MATEDITLAIKLDAVKSALREIPILTEKEFSRMEKVASKTLRQVDKEAVKAIRDAEKAAEKAQAALEKAAEEQMQSVQRVGDMFTGGLVGDLEDVGKAFGPIGAAAMGAAAGVTVAVGAVGALGAAIVGIQKKAEDTIKRLDELGMKDVVTPEQREAVLASQAAFEAMDNAVGKVAITLAANFSADIQQAARFVLELTDRVDGFLKSIKNRSLIEEFAVSFVVVRDSVTSLMLPLEILAKAFGMLQQATTGSRGEFGDWGYAQIEARKAAAAAATGIDRLQDSIESLTQGQQKQQDTIEQTKKGIQEEKDETEKSRKAHEAREKALKAEQKAQEEYARILKEATSDQETEEMKLLRAHVERSEAAKKAITDETALAKALAEINARLYRDWDKLETDQQKKADEGRKKQLDAAKKENELYEAWVAQRNQKEIELAEKTFQIKLEAGQALLDAIQKEAEEEEKAFLAVIDTISGLVGPVMNLANTIADLSRERLARIRDERTALREQIEEATGYEKARLEARLKGLDEEAVAYKRAALAAFRVRQGAAIAETIVNGVVAASRALAELGPVAGGIAAGVIAAATTANVALIAAEQPRFHAGLDPSETPAILTRGEGVANARAMSQPGFADELRAANAGLPSPVAAPVVIALNDRVLAQLDARTRRIRGRDYGSRTMVRLGSANHYMGG